jgi:hypothetical protein
MTRLTAKEIITRQTNYDAETCLTEASEEEKLSRYTP